MKEYEYGFNKWGKYFGPFNSDEELSFRKKWARAFLEKYFPDLVICDLTQNEIGAYREWDTALQKRLGSAGTRLCTLITYSEYLRDTHLLD